MGIEEVVDGKAKEVPEPVVETPQPEAPEAAIEPVAEPAPEIVPEAAPAAEAPREEKTIPLATALDWRDRFKAAEAKLAEVEAAKQPSKVPDALDDPDGFNAHVDMVADAKATAVMFKMSNAIATREFGKETVDTAIDWATERAKSDPSFVQKYMQNDHPIDWIVRQHKREGLVGGLPDDVSDLDEYVKRRATELGLIAATAAPAVVVPQQAPATPPRSLASQPSAGGVKDVPVGPMAGLEALFTR